MPSGPFRSSGSSSCLRSQRLIRNDQNSVGRKFVDKLFGVGLRLLEVDIKLFADPVADDVAQGSVSVVGLEDRGCYLAQGEEGGIGGVHDHHFTGQGAGGDGGTARDVNRVVRHLLLLPGNPGFGPTLCHQDRTSGGKWEPWKQNRRRWRRVFRPRPGLRRKTECCASSAVRLRWRTGRRCDFPGLARERKERRWERSSSHRL